MEGLKVSRDADRRIKVYFMLLYTVVHHYHLLLLCWTFSGDRKTVKSVCPLKVMELSRHTWNRQSSWRTLAANQTKRKTVWEKKI